MWSVCLWLCRTVCIIRARHCAFFTWQDEAGFVKLVDKSLFVCYDIQSMRISGRAKLLSTFMFILVPWIWWCRGNFKMKSTVVSWFCAVYLFFFLYSGSRQKIGVWVVWSSNTLFKHPLLLNYQLNPWWLIRFQSLCVCDCEDWAAATPGTKVWIVVLVGQFSPGHCHGQWMYHSRCEHCLLLTDWCFYLEAFCCLWCFIFCPEIKTGYTVLFQYL